MEGENGDISGIGQTLAGQDLCQTLPQSMKPNYLQEKVGHDGNGGDWQPGQHTTISVFTWYDESYE